MKHNKKFGKLGTKLGNSLGNSSLGSSISTVGSMRPGAVPLSVEFGVSGIKVLQLTGSNPSSIVSAAFMPTPVDLIATGQMVCKHLQIIPTEGVPLEQIASAQLSSQLGCDPAELLVRCRPVHGAQSKGKLEVICFAASREFVGRIMGSLKNANRV